MSGSCPSSNRGPRRRALLTLVLVLVGPLSACQQHEDGAPSGEAAELAPTATSAAASTQATPATAGPASEPSREPAEPLLTAAAGPELLSYPATGEAPGVLLLGAPLPSVAYDVGVAPDGSFSADRASFGDGNGCLLMPASGAPAAGGRFAGELWVRGKRFDPGATVDVFLIDERKDLAYRREVVALTDEWQRVQVSHAFESADGDSAVSLRLGNDFAQPSPVELWFWGPRIVREGAGELR